MASDGEDDDFRAAMSDVAPLDPRLERAVRARELELEEKRALPHEVSASQLERQKAALGLGPSAADDNPLSLGEVPEVGPREVVEWKKEGVQQQVFARLRNGHYPVQGSLDLHRLSVREARQAVHRFLKLAEAKRWRTVLIAHGRGEKSPTPARLKSYVVHWLGQLPAVIAYSSAERRLGGTGATLVMLRKSALAREEARETFGLKSDLEP